MPTVGADPDFIELIGPFYRALRRYARLVVNGLENVPSGKAVLVANHTGWAGLDYAFMFLVLHDDAGRFPRVAVHPSFGRIPGIEHLEERLGMFRVSVTTATKVLDEGNLVAVFPEAEHGNFKPFWQQNLAPFHPGAARIALAANAPVVPTVIVGGEESNPVLGTLPTRKALGLDLPIPLSLVPLPAKWRIRFLPPMEPKSYLEGDAQDSDAAEAMTAAIKERIEEGLAAERKARGNPFL
ncbi:MAG: 1-acyl-sn-glycerol-3-phosphate acyltransferase [Thermoplasmatota archaeon]